MTDFELGYLAGLVDADGSISINKGKELKRGGHGYSPVLNLTSTDKEYLLLIQNVLNTALGTKGYLHTRKHTKYKDRLNWKNTYTLIYTCKQALKIIETIEPYMLLKKERANLVISYYNNQPTEIEKLITIREDIYNRMRKLNKRGVTT